MKVININDTHDTPCECGCGSWLNHWVRFSRAKVAGLCKEQGCSEIATVGALVQKSDSKDEGCYIVPLCNRHRNMRDRGVKLFGSPKLVSTNAYNKAFRR